MWADEEDVPACDSSLPSKNTLPHLIVYVGLFIQVIIDVKQLHYHYVVMSALTSELVSHNVVQSFPPFLLERLWKMSTARGISSQYIFLFGSGETRG